MGNALSDTKDEGPFGSFWTGVVERTLRKVRFYCTQLRQSEADRPLEGKESRIPLRPSLTRYIQPRSVPVLSNRAKVRGYRYQHKTNEPNSKLSRDGFATCATYSVVLSE